MFRSWISRCVIVGCVVPLNYGCHQFPNNFVDDLPDSSLITTASRDRARASGAEHVQRTRGFEEVQIDAQDGTVVHGPLYTEDPVEMYGSDDGQFAITHEDFLAFWSTPFRFHLNAALYPISILVTPPYRAMASDGVPSRKICCWMHDATPLPSPTG